MLRLLWFGFLRHGFKIVRLFMMSSFKIHGRENLPESGPYIVAVNHLGLLDSPAIFLSVPTNEWCVFAADKWRDNLFTRYLLGWSGAVWIKRGEVDRAALQTAMESLKKGKIFGLAPEGTRSKTGTMARGRDGAAYLATKARVPIIPIGIVGSENHGQNYRSGRWTTVESFIGPPFELPELGRRIRSKDLPAYTHYIMIMICQQLPEQYWGVYADSPALAAVQRGEDPWSYCMEAEGVTA
jgi:1-acyl-sn-glycerol-3-phosphate acyltransferase